MPFEVSRAYRTAHSLKDHEVEFVIKQVEANRPSVFVDYGCHMGHLSFELAHRFDMTIFAVDNFKGTVGDEWMRKTIHTLTNGRMNFYSLFIANMAKACQQFKGFKGRIIPLRTDWFYRQKDLKADFIFVDSSHRVEDAYEFIWLARRLNPNGILGGHDNANTCPGVQLGIRQIVDQFDWVQNDFTFFLRKRSAPQ